MLTEICQYLRNWFDKGRPKYHGEFTIANNKIVGEELNPEDLPQGMHYRIIGSLLNDGVHKTGGELFDETFNGSVWFMAIPPSLVKLSEEIEEWVSKYGGATSAAMSPFASEAFGGYAYTKAQGYAAAGGGMLTSWQAVYESRLAPWRKI